MNKSFELNSQVGTKKMRQWNVKSLTKAFWKSLLSKAP